MDMSMPPESLGGGRRLRLCDGIDAAHHPGANDGRPVSQANLAGYRAVIDAAANLWPRLSDDDDRGRHDPPAKVFVMGAGVAGLQAIATARRLGAVVSATDVRPAPRSRWRASARSSSRSTTRIQGRRDGRRLRQGDDAEYQAKQAELVAEHIAKQDIVITTALIPGRAAPARQRRAWSKPMRPGSVIVDLAVEHGGNVEGADPARSSTRGVKIVGIPNLPGASATPPALYASNLLALLPLIAN